MNAPAAGWNPDPAGRHEYRYWDGNAWTDDVSDGGIASVDPLPATPSPTTATQIGDAPTTIAEPTQQFAPQPGDYGSSPTGFGAQPGGYPPQGDAYGSGQSAWGSPPGGFPGQTGGYGGPPGADAGPGFSGQYPPSTPVKSGPPGALVIGLVAALVVVVGVVGFILTRSDGDGDETSTDQTGSTTPNDGATTAPATTASTAPATTAATGPEDADVFSLVVGDCLAEQSTEETVSEVPVVPCDQPHTSEIFYSHIIPGDTLPTATEMEGIVDAECISRFEGFVGIPYDDSELLVTWLEPTAESWEAGDRELLCMVEGPPGEVVGTLQNSNR